MEGHVIAKDADMADEPQKIDKTRVRG